MQIMGRARKLQVKIKNPYGLFIFDTKKQEFRVNKAPDLAFLDSPPKAGKKSVDLLDYTDRDRRLRVYLLDKGRTRTVAGSLTLTAGSPGERAVRELVKNRRLQGIEYDLARMMMELIAYKYRRRFGENAARPCLPGEGSSFFNWSVPALDLGAPRGLIFSETDLMYVTGCYDQRLSDHFPHELQTLSRGLSIGYQVHLAMSEFFDSFVAASADAVKKAARFFSEVPPSAAALACIEPRVTREFFASMDRAHQLLLKVRQSEDRAEEVLWQAKLEAGKEDSD
jgi:hypothetical protein